jgi:hypothetical protein
MIKSAGSVFGACVAGCLLVASPADAQTKLRVGTLTCKGSGKVGLIIGSQQSLACTFQPASNRRPQRYRATITKLGLDVGVQGPSTMVWTVLSATSRFGSGFLVGNYVGASADASVGVGGGGKILVGGNNNSVTLQPLSLQGQTGINLAVGVAELKIR